MLVKGTSSYDGSHSFLSTLGQFEGRKLLFKLLFLAISTTVAIETTGSIGGDQLSISEAKIFEDVSLLTKKILLMVTV